MPMPIPKPVLQGSPGLQASAWRQQQQQYHNHDAARLHPVFFSRSLHRTQFAAAGPMGAADVAHASPVALGYGDRRNGPRL
jgi:hypothetical protein